MTDANYVTTEQWFETLKHEEREKQLSASPKSPFDTKYLSCEVLPHGEGLPLPAHQIEGSAGLDLYAAVEGSMVIPAGKMGVVPTGLCVGIYAGFKGDVCSRSGLAFNNQVFVLNAPGVIDNGFSGEIKILLMNLGESDFVVTRGMRVAQLIVTPYHPVILKRVEKLADSVRGTGGFGSSGL